MSKKTKKRKQTRSQKNQTTIEKELGGMMADVIKKARHKPSLRKALVQELLLGKKGKIKKYTIEKLLGEPLD